MRMVDIIEKKRDGRRLTSEKIQFIINGYINGSIPDHQVSVFLMAVFYQDMTDKEATQITLAMIHSGETVDLSPIERIKVDKRSTGGVGDTTILILAPLVASVGVNVAKMSGRGLGYTGGTLGKLEVIPGFKVELTGERFIQLVNNTEVAVIGQSGDLAPADRKLYALRDMTATVDSIPLIVNSVMSKKITTGADAIVLDVTTNEGAFMKDLAGAHRLAETIVRIGKLANRQTMAVISDMSQPLEEAVGNSLEVVEAIETLQGDGPGDLMEMCYVLGSQMVVLVKKAETLDGARASSEEALASGRALAEFREMIENQGGDSSVVDQSEKLLTATYQFDLSVEEAGVVQKIVASEIGVAAMLLGADRATKEDTVGFAVGLKLHKKVGSPVEGGESLLTIYANREGVTEVEQLLYRNIEIGPIGEEPILIHDIVTE